MNNLQLKAYEYIVHLKRSIITFCNSFYWFKYLPCTTKYARMKLFAAWIHLLHSIQFNEHFFEIWLTFNHIQQSSFWFFFSLFQSRKALELQINNMEFTWKYLWTKKSIIALSLMFYFKEKSRKIILVDILIV